MRGFRRASRRTLFVLLALAAGLYLIYSTFPWRRRRRSAKRPSEATPVARDAAQAAGLAAPAPADAPGAAFADPPADPPSSEAPLEAAASVPAAAFVVAAELDEPEPELQHEPEPRVVPTSEPEPQAEPQAEPEPEVVPAAPAPVRASAHAYAHSPTLPPVAAIAGGPLMGARLGSSRARVRTAESEQRTEKTALPPVAAIAGGTPPRRKGHRLLATTTLGLLLAGTLTFTAFASTPSLEAPGQFDNTHGAIYSFFNPLDPTGSGVFEAFVRLSTNNDEEEGYNTDNRPLQYDENNSPTFTHDAKLSGVPVVVGDCLPPATGDCLFREFQADLNQDNTDPGKFISLDEVEIYLHEIPSIDGRSEPGDFPGQDVDKIYELDNTWGHTGDPNHAFKIDTLDNSGSGKRDIRLLVPQEYFEASTFDNCPYTGNSQDPGCDTFVTLYSKFGGDTIQPDNTTYPNNGGFEEWGVAIYDATKSGVKFNDLNANGVRDASEPGLPAWTIYVDINGNDVFDPGEPNDVTDATGAYSIGPIPPGTFDVREVQQAGWNCSAPGGSGPPPVIVPSADCEYTEEFGITGDHVDNDFGNWRTARKSGQKFHDLNANGVKNAGEPGLPGWTIYVDYNANDAFDAATEPSAVTDASGNYEITGINIGTFDVREVFQAGWTCSFPNPAGTPAVSNDCEYTETFESGGSLTGNDFGNWRTATKSGQKFHDLNANGTEDAGEPGLDNWRIYVDYNGNDAFDAATEPSALTDASGNYQITGINPGTFDVREVLQPGWTCSFPNPAGTPAVSTDCEHTETFTSGAALTGNDFGNWEAATKSGQKFEDLNANGVKDAGEGGLENWRIYVDYNGNDAFDAATEPNDLTDASGNYQITGINPGTFDVREVFQTGWTCSFPNPAGTPAVSTDCEYTETFASSDDLTDNDFGNWTTATKLGQKFEDLNANGAKNAGEPGLPGWTIYVDYNGNDAFDAATEPSALTDASGNYTITGIVPGTFDVREVFQPNWTCSFPNPAGTPAVSSDCEYTETFTSRDEERGNDFGNWRSASKSGTKFHDLNANGINDFGGEPGLENWRIYVDYNGNDVWDAATEPFDLTDSNGDYLITGINPGTYDVREVVQPDWTCSFPNPAGTPAVSSDCEYTETFTSGVEEMNNDFGNWTTATKSGQKFHDLNANGAKNAGEPGLESWQIYVDVNGNDAFDAGEPTDLTDASGNYLITGINPGTYDVREVVQPGWTCSFPNPAGTPAVSSDCEYTETFTSGARETNNDFGNWTTATKSGQKFHDLNANGAEDAGEPGLENWQIYVDVNGNDAFDAGEPTDLTDASGNYLITGINPGTYDVREVLQTGWTCSFPNPAGTPAVSTDCEYTETFTSGAEERGNDFGNWTTASKSGMKFEDENANGVKDASEGGLSGWRIYVDVNGNDAFDAGEPFDDTDAGGNYTITGITPGGPVDVREVFQPGWTCSYPNPAGTPAVSTDCEYTETFASGDALRNNDFGNWESASKSGQKFEDENANGAKDAGEGGLAGWRIFVDYNGNDAIDPGEPFDDTDATGNYEITGIAPGTFDVREVFQTGWHCSYPGGVGIPAISPAADCEHPETFGSGDELTGNDFGNWQPATKAGQKFEDENANGAKDAGEGGLADWRIYVDYNGNDAIDPGEPFDDTDASGNYLITGINPGSFSVREVFQTGWHCSTPGGVGTPAIAPAAECEYDEIFTSSDRLTGNDFGNWRPATKAGQKFEDENANGAKDAGEGGLPGWRIYVDYNGNDAFDVGEPNDTTGALGNYEITGINPGSFSVREVFQTGWHCSTPGGVGTPSIAPAAECEYDEIFTSSDRLTGNDFGNWRPATKAGQKFEDENANGQKDAGEGGLAGWRIYVDYNGNDAFDAGEPTDVTGALGNYLITGINPGSFSVREVFETGWHCSTPGGVGTPSIAPAADCEHDEVFTSSDELTGNDFGNWRPATKAGQKFEDENADGIKDAGEAGLAGWRIYVDYNGNDQFDSGEPFDDTGALGNYLITGINPGSFSVREVFQPGWHCSTPGGVGTPKIAPDAACEHDEVFTSSDELTGNDFGNWRPATKSGQKFHDLNANGQKDAGEGGLSGWRIYVDYNGNDAIDPGEPFDDTDASGNYEITGIDPGTFDVREVFQTGWTCSYPNPAGTPAVSTDCEHTETFTSSDRLTDNDFGNWHAATKSGVKFNDLNMNGSRDAGEPGLPGWEIRLITPAGVVVATDTTDGNGAYEFPNVTPGINYLVCEVAQSGWVQSLPGSGADCDAVNAVYAPWGYAINLDSNEVDDGNDFGNFQPPNEGCTPGYWKNHPESWPPTGYTTGQTLESVFDIPDNLGLDATTLIQALDLPGGTGPEGAARILARAAVAALLNAAHPGVDYPLTTAQVIAQVNTAFAGNRGAMIALASQLDAYNNLGCPLN